MSIKVKLLLVIVFAVALTTASILGTASIHLGTAFTNNFQLNSKAQLDRMSAFVNLFFSSTIGNTKLIATSPVTLRNAHALTSYANITEPTKTIGLELPDGERELFIELQRFYEAFPSYMLLYVGHSNSGFVQAPDDGFTEPYNPAERPWFTDTIAAGKPIITEAYASGSHEIPVMVCTITAPVDMRGNGQAVVGIDFELTTLSKEISSVTIGKTGYLMMLDHFGQIVADPKSGTQPGQRAWLGKAIRPVPTDDSVEVIPQEAASALQSLVEKKSGFAEIEMDGMKWLAGVQTTEQGWTLIMLQSKDEIFSDAFAITMNILQVGVVITIAMIIIAFVIARGIAQPVITLSAAAEGVANGDLNAIPKDKKAFTGELGVLHYSLQRMVGKLSDLIQTAEGKIKEAEEALQTSKTALQQAEEAKSQAESARSEAIHETATRLASIVGNLAENTQSLEKEAGEAAQNVDTQRDRVANTAAAINQMNAAVAEVASSIAKTSNLADDARQGAITGKTLVLDVVESIKHMENSSKELSASLETLGAQVTDIGQIMSVINDIADQTNLLALNAAIEAARAGEAGRGFAVVADEVRKLAESTMQATKQVGTAIKNIQKGTAENRSAMEMASNAVAKSTELAEKAGQAIEKIEKLVVNTADNLRNIAAASEEQSATAEEINQSTQDVSLLAEKVSQGAHNTTSITKNLVGISSHLSKIIQDLQK